LHVSHNDTLCEKIKDPQAMTGSILAGIRQVADAAADLGRGLRPGDLVFLGSVIPMQILQLGDRFTVKLSGAGAVSLEVKPAVST